MMRVFKFILTDILPLGLILAIILVFAIIPYRSQQAQLKLTKDIDEHQCAFEHIVRNFMLAASEARDITQTVFINGKRVIVFIPKNVQISDKYKHFANSINNLPSPC